MNDMEKSLYNGTPLPSKTKDEIDKYLKKTLGVGMDEIEATSISNQDDDETEELKGSYSRVRRGKQTGSRSSLNNLLFLQKMKMSKS